MGTCLHWGGVTKDKVPPRRELIAQRQAVAYPMGYAIGIGFVSVLWGQGRMVSDSGEFTPLYQGSSSNFWEGNNLTSWIKNNVYRGEL